MATIRKRKNGSYEIKVSCGYGVDGKQHNQYKSYYPEPGMTPKQIEKEVNRQAVLFEEECKKGQITSAIKFETFAEQWLEEYAKVNLRATSYSRMIQVTKRIYPALGHKRLDKITSRDIQKFITGLLINEKNLNNGKSLSRKTVVHHLNFISDVFSYAVRMGMLTDNPCRRVVVPKIEQTEKEIYTLDEVKKLFSSLQNEPLNYQVYLTLAIYSGFRRSEMLGLEWKDIDFNYNTIKIRRTSQYTAEKGIYTDTTKTKKSQRISKFPDTVMELLKRFQQEQLSEAYRLGSKWEDHDRLFTKWNGAPMYPQTPSQWFSKFLARHGLKHRKFHALRHTSATLLLLGGLNIKQVSGRLGHADLRVTNLYLHCLQEADTAAPGILQNMLITQTKNNEEQVTEKQQNIG